MCKKHIINDKNNLINKIKIQLKTYLQNPKNLDFSIDILYYRTR